MGKKIDEEGFSYNHVVTKFGNYKKEKRKRKEELSFLQEDAHCGDVKCHGESDYFLPEYIINIFVLIGVYFTYLSLSTVKRSSIVLYFTLLTLQLLGILFKKHLFPSALGVVGSEAILFGKR